mmetsp:Transcript_37048/g.103048  ORF Transcript_37048/g.103048 Transcript_37048/m.103048 type:complete len:383 (-) Transcript_37048:1695-2843(-)
MHVLHLVLDALPVLLLLPDHVLLFTLLACRLKHSLPAEEAEVNAGLPGALKRPEQAVVHRRSLHALPVHVLGPLAPHLADVKERALPLAQLPLEDCVLQSLVRLFPPSRSLALDIVQMQRVTALRVLQERAHLLCLLLKGDLVLPAEHHVNHMSLPMQEAGVHLAPLLAFCPLRKAHLHRCAPPRDSRSRKGVARPDLEDLHLQPLYLPEEPLVHHETNTLLGGFDPLQVLVHIPLVLELALSAVAAEESLESHPFSLQALGVEDLVLPLREAGVLHPALVALQELVQGMLHCQRALQLQPLALPELVPSPHDQEQQTLARTLLPLRNDDLQVLLGVLVDLLDAREALLDPLFGLRSHLVENLGVPLAGIFQRCVALPTLNL